MASSGSDENRIRSRNWTYSYCVRHMNGKAQPNVDCISQGPREAHFRSLWA